MLGLYSLSVDLGVQIQERSLGIRIKTVQAQLNRLQTIAEDAKCLGNMNQTTSRDDLINRTISKRFADDLSPSDQTINEDLVSDAVEIKVLIKNLTLSRSWRILLFNGDRKTLKKGFVEDVGADESTIITTLALGVCSSNHIEASGRMNDLASLLIEIWIALKNRLQAQNVFRTKITLVEQKNRTTTHCRDHRTFATHGAAVNQLIRANKIGLVGTLGDIDADQLTLE